MPVIVTDPELELMRNKHRTQLYLSIARPATMLIMRVNGTFDDGETVVVLDNGTLFASFGFGDVVFALGCEVWIGVTSGGDELGRLRLRDLTGDETAATATFSANNVPWQDNAYVTFKLDFRVRPRFPKIIPSTETFTKEWGDLNYSDDNEDLSPVVVAGPHQSWFTDGLVPFVGSLAVDLTDSYTTAQGATIANYETIAIAEDGTGGMIIPGSVSSGSLNINSMGGIWVRYRITDSNGKEQRSWRWLSVHSRDPGSSYYPITEFSNVQISGNWGEGGWKANLNLTNPEDTQFDDGALAVLWAETEYWDEDSQQWSSDIPTLLPGTFTTDFVPYGSRVLVAGYIRRDTANQNRDNGVGGLAVEISTIEGVLRTHYMFSISLEAVSGTPDTWWKFVSYLNARLAVHHFWRWHTNLFELCDVIALTDNPIGRAYAEIENSNFYTMPDDFLRNVSIRCHVTSDKGGRVHVTPEVQLLKDTERDALDDAFEITKPDTSGIITFRHEPEDKVPFVEVSGFSFGGLFDGEGKPIVTPHCAIAPGEVPADWGESPINMERQTLENQEHAEIIAGRQYGWSNNEWPEVQINFPGDYLRVLEPAVAMWYKMDVAAADTIFDEKLVWTNKRLILRSVEVNIDVSNGNLLPSATFEPEADALPGIPRPCPTVPDDGGGEPDDIPGDTSGPVVITGSSAYYLPLADAVWDLRSNASILDLAADPWWRIKQDSTDPADGIVVACGQGYIMVSNDAMLNWTDVTPDTDPPNCAGDTPDPIVEDLTFIRRDSSYLSNGEHVFLARYLYSGKWRSWLLHTPDDFQTWNWVCLNDGGGTGWGTEYEIGAQMFRGSIVEDYVGGYPLRVLAQLDTDKFFFMFRGGDGVGCVIGVRNGDGTISFGDVYYLDTTMTISAPYLGTCAAIDANTVAMVYGSIDLWAAVANVTGTVISFSSQTLVGDASVDVAGAVFNTAFASPMLCQMLDDVFMLSAAVGVTLSGGLATTLGVYTRCITFDVTGVTGTGSWVAGDTSIAIESVDIYKIDDNTVFAALGALRGNPIVSNNHYSRGVVIQRSGLGISYGTAGNVDAAAGNRGFPGVACDGTSVMVFSRTSLTTTVVTPITADTGLLTFSLGTPAVVATDTAAEWSSFCAWRVAPNEFMVAAARSAFEMVVWRLTGTTLDETIDLGAGFNHGYDISLTPLGTDNFILVYGGRVRSYTVGGGGGEDSDVKALDIRIGRGDGAIFYITASDATNDFCYLFTANQTPELIDQFSVAAAASDDLWVESDWGDDDVLILYGNFTHPSIGISHLLISSDAGVNFSPYQTGWGGSVAGAVRVMNNNIYAIRNVDGEAKLYINNTLKSTIPFPAGVNPRGMVVSTRGTVFVAADDGQSLMVYMTRSPYTSWTNITYNHGTGNGVNAIDLL